MIEKVRVSEDLSVIVLLKTFRGGEGGSQGTFIFSGGGKGAVKKTTLCDVIKRRLRPGHPFPEFYR